MLKLLIEPTPDALSDPIDPAWEAATDSRQRLKCSYAMDATMPEQANYRAFTKEPLVDEPVTQLRAGLCAQELQHCGHGAAQGVLRSCCTATTEVVIGSSSKRFTRML